MATEQVLQSPVQPASPSPTRYRSYSSRVNVTLGIIQILCAVFLMGLNIALIRLDSPIGHASDGIWCGLIIILSGSFQIAAGKAKTNCWIVTSLAFAIFAVFFVIPVLIFGAVDISHTRDNENSFHEYWDPLHRFHLNSFYPGGNYNSHYGPDIEPWNTLYALNGLKIFIAVVQGIIAIIASVMACGPLCCNKTQTVAQHQTQYVANQPGQVITITKPAATNQSVMAVPVAQGFTASVLTSFGEPPRYTVEPGEQTATQQGQLGSSQEGIIDDNWINDIKKA